MSFEDPLGRGAFANAPLVVPSPAAPAARWSVAVSLGGSVVSSNLTGLISIEAEESTSRLARFTLRPGTGAVDVRDWVGAAVTIDYVPSGESAIRLFTGIVEQPIYDVETRLTEFRCTDDLQGHFEAKTQAQILTALSNDDYTGRYSDRVFGLRDDGWRQAEDILSTIPCGYDLLKDGSTGVLTAWAAATAALAFDESNARFVEVQIAKLRDLVNQISIEADYRYSREHHREIQFNWVYDGLCDFIGGAYELPTRSMIRQAAEGTNWINKNGGYCFQTLPENGQYCNGKGLSVSEEARKQVVISASWRGVRRWVQTVEEQYRITVREAGSVTDYGARIDEDGAGYEVANDDATWSQSLETNDPASPDGGDLAGYQLSDCGSTMLETGKSWEWTDKDDETERLALLDTLVQIADTKIRSSHRNNFVEWQTWIQPDLERTQTLSIDAAGVQATGKVFQYRHDLNLAEGSALTSIKIAVSKCPSGGSQDTLDAPARPNTTSGYSDPAISVDMTSKIGFQAGAAAYDENWEGFTSNRTVYQGATGDEDKIYPVRFQVVGPDIEAAAVDSLEVEQAETIDILIPDETLTVTA